MQIKQILKLAAEKNLDQLDSELLVALVLKKDRLFVLSRPKYNIKPGQVAKIISLIKQRAKGVPFAYLSGQKEFYSLNFKVKPGVLIPRPETELIVEYILNHFKSEDISLIDLGCGSGNIIISVARNKADQNKYLGLDISPQALTISKYNAKYHDLENKIHFVQSDLLKKILKSPTLIKYLNPEKQDRLVISANLPYLTAKQIKANPDLKYEPRLALSAGPDGLKYYKKLLPQIKKLQKLGFPKITLILEIDPSQTKTLKQYIRKIFPDLKDKIINKNDLAGLSRFIIIDVENK